VNEHQLSSVAVAPPAPDPLPIASKDLPNGLSGNWWLERSGGKNQIKIAMQSDSDFTASYVSIKNPSIFSGKLITDSSGKIIIQFTQIDPNTKFSATHNGELLSEERFEGTFDDNRNRKGVSFKLYR